MKKIFVTAVMAVLLSTVSAESVPAFLTAEGYGMWATGGRGGQIVEVTNLEDDSEGSIEGSLRWALKQYSSQPITVVFRVSGVIELVADLRSSRTAGTTIAGQTAPGDGICIRGAKCNFGGSKNLIIRHMRFRIGLKELGETEDGQDSTAFIAGGSIGIENAENFILDHCSFGWSGEENMTIYDNKMTTIQWCLVHEGLYNAGHGKGNRGYGTQWGGQTATYHHNLIAHCYNRTPRFNGARSNDLQVMLDYVNNVNYNWGNQNAAYGGDMAEGNSHKVNMVNNYYKPGPARPGTNNSYFVRASFNSAQTTSQIPLWYLSGNYMEGSANTSKNTNNLNGLNADEYTAKGIEKTKIVSTTHFEVPYPVTTETAAEAYKSVLAGVGAFPRDTIERRIINEVRTGTAICKGSVSGVAAGIIDRPKDAGGYPEYDTYNEVTDNDHDGMDDLWEAKNGLDSTNANDRNLILKSGYTALDAYLGSLVGEDIPVETAKIYDFVVAQDGSGDFTTINAAIEAAPEGGERTLILVKNGTYEEKVYIGSHSVKINKVISLIGEDRDKVIVRWDDYVGKPIYYYYDSTKTVSGGQYIATMTINAPDFYMENMTVENPYTQAQAIALYNASDGQTFNHCNILGFQDTHRSKKNCRSFFFQSTIEGGTDFIYAGGTVYFYQCNINSSKAGYITAPEDITTSVRMPSDRTLYYGFIFNDCDITADASVASKSTYLGRPWEATSGSIFMNSRLGKHIKDEGWSTWEDNKHLTTSFAEYQNMNADGTALADVSKRVSWSMQLTDDDYYDCLSLSSVYKAVSTTTFDPLSLVTQTPKAPKTLTVKSKSLTWTQVANAVGYMVYANDSIIAYTATNAFNDVIDRVGTITYKVRAIGVNGGLSGFNGTTSVYDTLTLDKLTLALNPIKPITTNICDTIRGEDSLSMVICTTIVTKGEDTLSVTHDTSYINALNRVAWQSDAYYMEGEKLLFKSASDYDLYDVSGRLLQKGRSANECDMNFLQKGLYILRFRNEAGEFGVVKFQRK